MIKVEAIGEVRNGELKIVGRKHFDLELKSFPDCDVTVIVKKRGKRTNPTNKYYWGCIVRTIRVELNNRGFKMDDEQVHEFLKLHFNKRYIHDDAGEVIGEFGGSTAEMNQDEMSNYFERICQWAAEKLSLVIAPPNSQSQLFAA